MFGEKHSTKTDMKCFLFCQMHTHTNIHSHPLRALLESLPSNKNWTTQSSFQCVLNAVIVVFVMFLSFLVFFYFFCGCCYYLCGSFSFYSGKKWIFSPQCFQTVCLQEFFFAALVFATAFSPFFGRLGLRRIFVADDNDKNS